MDNQEITQITDSQVEENIFGNEGLDPFAEAEQPQETVERIASPRNNVVQENSPAPPQQEQAPNDEVRYQYWQSEADKRQNRISELEVTNSKLQDTLMKNFNKEPASVPAEQQQQAEPAREEFPPPPEKPVKPQHFDRAEAYTDPHSDSAQYLDTVETWRENMDTYNRLHTEYNAAVIQQEREEMKEAETQRINAVKQAEEAAARDSELRNSLRTDYNAAPEVIDDFIQKMSDPESVTVENLWKLYQLDHGGMERAAPVKNPPSEDFEQTRKAQSIPSPMGVMPSSNREQTTSSEDRIMDDMIKDYRAQNPFD